MNNRTACFVAHIAVLGCLLGGCVPVPFRPSATVTPVPVTADNAVPMVTTAVRNSEAQSVAKAIHQDEARVVLVDATAFSAGIGSSRTALTAVLASARTGHEALAADYVLSVGHPLQRQLHDTGAAAPFLFFPVIVGYEKWQSMATLPATLIDVRDPQSLQVLCAASAYSEVATGLVYGFATIAMPEPGLRRALALEVAHRLADAQPTGDIRLLVVSQAYDTKPGQNDPKTGPSVRDPICDAAAPAPTTTAALVH